MPYRTITIARTRKNGYWYMIISILILTIPWFIIYLSSKEAIYDAVLDRPNISYYDLENTPLLSVINDPIRWVPIFVFFLISITGGTYALGFTLHKYWDDNSNNRGRSFIISNIFQFIMGIGALGLPLVIFGIMFDINWFVFFISLSIIGILITRHGLNLLSTDIQKGNMLIFTGTIGFASLSLWWIYCSLVPYGIWVGLPIFIISLLISVSGVKQGMYEIMNHGKIDSRQVYYSEPDTSSYSSSSSSSSSSSESDNDSGDQQWLSKDRQIAAHYTGPHRSRRPPGR